MNEIEINAKAKRIRSIPFALRVIGVGILLSLIPLGLAFNEYRAANPDVELSGSFVEKLETVLKFHMDSEGDAIWMKVFLLALPAGLAVVIFGLSQTVLRYMIPLVLGLAIALGLLCAHIFFCWLFPEKLPRPDLKFTEFKGWGILAINTLIGSTALLIGGLLTLKESVLVKTFLNLIIGTAFSLLITLFYPFILLGGAYFLHKKKEIPYSRLLLESGNLYNFLILNIYPIFFEILPGLGLVKRNAKKEAKAYKKKYKNGDVPKYTSSLDFDKLKFGDVILTGRPSWGKSAAIQASNLLSCGEDSRYWSHAVIYAGHPPNGDTSRHNIIEAQSNGKGVQEIDLITGEKVIYKKNDTGEPIKDKDGNYIVKEFTKEEKRRFNYTDKGDKKIFTPEKMENFSDQEKELCFEKSYFEEGFYLMVLRPKYADQKTLEKVVDFCRKRDGDGCGYDTWGVSFYSLCALVPPMLSGWLEEEIANRIFNVDNAYFCSELLADAFRYGANQEIFDRSSWRVKPLDFRLNPLFEEVDCGYKRTPANQAARDEVAETIASITALEQKVKAHKDNFTDAQFDLVTDKLAKAKKAAELGQYPSSDAKKLYVNPSMAWGLSEQAPEVETPEVSAPEEAAPEVSAPEPSAPEVATPELSTPEVSTPETSFPEVATPEVSTPETKSPINPSDVKFPKMEFPRLKTSKAPPLEKKGDTGD